MVYEHSFGDGNWALGIALIFSALALTILARLLWKRRGLPAWQLVLSLLLVGASGAVAGLAWRDCSTKIARLELRTDPPSLTIQRRFPPRTRVLVPGDLLGIGLVTLGTELEDEDGGERQLVLAQVGSRELRSFLEHDPPAALAIAKRIADAFGLELQRFAGPPSLKNDAAPR